MPLPDGGPWPPPAHAPAYDSYAKWSAWYTGDPDGLAEVYGGSRYDRTAEHSFEPPTGGGIRNRLRRMFWGQTITAGQQPPIKLHVPAPADIATLSADLLFSERAIITVQESNTKLQDRIEEARDSLGFDAFVVEAAEVSAAMSGVYLRVGWDREIVPDHPLMTAVHPDAAVPEFRYGRLVAVTFWAVVARHDDVVIRHLERHEPGAILHGLYEGTASDLGRNIPLTENPATAGIAVDENSAVAGIPGRLAVVYVPNIRPNRAWRSNPTLAANGRSDYSGVEQAFDALDEVWTSWMRDIRLGKGRVMLPEYMLESQGRGQGAVWDTDREIYAGLNMAPDATSASQLTVSQFAIRYAEHQATCAELLRVIARSAGYSPASLGEGGDVTAVTATEVNARERKSMITREKKGRYWAGGLAHAWELYLMADELYFGGPGVERPDVTLQDSVQEQPATLAQTASLLRTAEAASTYTLVKLVHPDWDDDAIDTEVQKIQDESGRNVPSPTVLGAGV